MLEEEARKRQTAGINQYSSLPELIPEGEKGESRDQAGEMFGVCGQPEWTRKIPENPIFKR